MSKARNINPKGHHDPSSAFISDMARALTALPVSDDMYDCVAERYYFSRQLLAVVVVVIVKEGNGGVEFN